LDGRQLNLIPQNIIKPQLFPRPKLETSGFRYSGLTALMERNGTMKNKVFSLFCALGLLLIVAIAPVPVRGDIFADDFIPDEVIVTLKPGRTINGFHARFGSTTLEQLTGTATYRVKLKPGDLVVDVLDEIQADTDVQAAQPNFEFESPEVRQSGMAFLDQSGMAFHPQIFTNNLRSIRCVSRKPTL
jgi:hypothetical protein